MGCSISRCIIGYRFCGSLCFEKVRLERINVKFRESWRRRKEKGVRENGIKRNIVLGVKTITNDANHSRLGILQTLFFAKSSLE